MVWANTAAPVKGMRLFTLLKVVGIDHHTTNKPRELLRFPIDYALLVEIAQFD